MTLDHFELLERYNPILILYPQDTSRRWPGARGPGRRGWGDYHPCSAEFFLARVRLRDQTKFYDFWGRFRSWKELPRDGVDELKTRLAQVSSEQTRDWELDLSDIPSQKEQRAWAVYSGLLQEDEHPYKCVVYGRVIEGQSSIFLQYWYLYLYNDFGNNHEADWEMASIELAPDGTPQRVGISCHHRGFASLGRTLPRSQRGRWSTWPAARTAATSATADEAIPRWTWVSSGIFPQGFDGSDRFSRVYGISSKYFP